jgi:PEP-CTERM motif-containing protein
MRVMVRSPRSGEQHMRTMLLAGAALLGLIAPAYATLQIEVFDNGTLIDNVSGITTGAASLTTNDANFANITINAQGSPILPNADLSSVTLDASAAAGFTGSHILTFDVLQSAVTGRGNTLSTFTVNGLVNDPGPTTESTFADGALLATHTFPAGLLDGSFGTVSSATGAFTSDEVQFAVDFTGARQSFGGSAQLTTNVPEPSTWAMLVAGFGFLVLLGVKQRKSGRLISI